MNKLVGAVAGTPMDKLLDAVEWVAVPQGKNRPEDAGIPVATHSGFLNFLGFDLKVFQLDNGTRLIDAESLEAFFEQLSTVQFPSR